MEQLSFKEKRRLLQHKKRKRISLIAIAFFLISIPLMIILYQPYLYYIGNPNTINNVLNEAKDIQRPAIESNEAFIGEYVDRISKPKQAEADSIETVLLEENNPYRLSNDKAKAIYDETGITYDFKQIESIRSIPSDTILNRNLLRGQILIPEVEMNLPIVEGVSNENLYIGTSTMKPNQKLGKGNYALAGHLMPDSDTLFSPLKAVNRGMNVYVTDKDMVYTYQISDIKEVRPSTIELISDEQGDGLLTLVTCSNDAGKNRLIVQAELVNEQSINRIEQDIYNQFME